MLFTSFFFSTFDIGLLAATLAGLTTFSTFLGAETAFFATGFAAFLGAGAAFFATGLVGLTAFLGAGFAVLLMNSATPLIDYYIKPRIYGRDRNGKPLEIPKP